ncbi:MAG: hypothetical protein ABSB69_00395 [Solirubrobacteraceae bacterium]
MIPLLVIAVWILVLSLVTGLCAAARAGDLAQLVTAPAGRGRGETTTTLWEQFEHAEISARASARPTRSPESGASRLRGDGVAA